MVVAEPETVIEFKAQPSQSLRRSANLTRRCAELKNVHKIHTQPAGMRTTPQLLRMLRPNAFARLQQRACAPLLRAGPLGRLQQRLRAVAEGHQGHGAAGMPRPHAGRHAFWRTATGATLCGRFKMVACKEGQTEHGVGISAWSAAVSVSFDSAY